MKLLFLKWFHRLMIRRDEARKARLMQLWPIERARLDNEYVKEIRSIQGAINHHNQELTKVEQERLWAMAQRRAEWIRQSDGWLP